MPMDDHGARERECLAAWALDLLPDPFDCPSYVGASYAREVQLTCDLKTVDDGSDDFF